MTKSSRRILTAIIAVALLMGAAALFFYIKLNGNSVSRPGVVYVPTGADYGQLLDSLENGAGARLESMSAFRKYAKMSGLDQGVKPGRYVVKEGMSYRETANMFHRGLQTPVRLTFNNVRTIDRLAGSLSRQIEADSASVYALFSDPLFTGGYGFELQTFIAMFIPNTYEVYWNTTPTALCDRMKKEYDRFWNEDRLAKLPSTGLTQLQVSILASIVYEETKKNDEMARVAGVYINRMRIGMPLQADPTVKFAVGDPALRRVLNVHLAVDSPYNTYLYRGLPPGPICMPSIRAIDAVLNYEHHNYLYFCASPDFSGYHRFATNLAQHARNAREYADALNRAGIR